jgi:hypothetical protein
MKVMSTVLASLVAAAVLAAPVAAQVSVPAKRSERAAQSRVTVGAKQSKLVATKRASLQKQQAVQQKTQQARDQKQRLARQQAQRQRQQKLRQQQQARREQQRRLWETWPEATETFSRTVRLGRSGTFDLQNVAGSVTVKGGGGDEVRIDAVKRVRHRLDAEARAALPDVRIDVIDREGNVEVRTVQSRRKGAVSFVDYTVNVPSGATVVLQTVSGDLHVSNVAGELRAQSVGGNITAAGVRRVRELRSASGTLDISDAESDELTAHTLSGDVLVRNLKGRVLEVQTVSGDVRFTGVEVDRARLLSTAGELEYGGRLARGGRYEFQTHSGDISISPLGNPGFTIEAETLNGDARSDFTLKAASSDLRPTGESLRGSVGDGSATVAVTSFGGDILLLRR